MSLPRENASPQQTKRYLLPSEDGEAILSDASMTLPKIESTDTKRIAVGLNGLLTPQSSFPIRPLSPDTLSNFSVDELEQLQPTQSLLFQHQNGANLNINSSNDATSSNLLRQRRQRRSPHSTSPWRHRLQTFYTHNLGLLYMLLAQFFGTLMNVTTRMLEVQGHSGRGMHPIQILFARMSLTLLLSTAYMYFARTPHFPLGAPAIRILLCVRGFAGFFGVFGMYYSLLYLPLADATVITFLAPGLACWACSILINEPFTRAEQVGGLVSLVGVVLIARPSTLFAAFAAGGAGSGDAVGDVTIGTTGSGDAVALLLSNSTASAAAAAAEVGLGDPSSYDGVTAMQRLAAVAVSLLGVLGAATAYTTIRWIGKRAHPLITVNYFSGFSTAVSIVGMMAWPGVGFLLPSDVKDWGYLIFLGVCGFVMQFLLAAGLSYEKSSRATNITYTQMLFALGADKLVFDHTPGLLSIIGSSLILGSAIVVALQKSGSAAPTSISTSAGSSGGEVDDAGDDDDDDDDNQGDGMKMVANGHHHRLAGVRLVADEESLIGGGAGEAREPDVSEPRDVESILRQGVEMRTLR